MGVINTMIPNALPECDFIRVLSEKASHRHDIEFNFLGKLEDFRRRVSDEVRQVNVLFPEYTPHDEQYHLKRLFHVADTILGKERLEEMNSAELFVLAIALYGHDWGMAVSEPEKQYVLTGESPKGTNVNDLWILPDERKRLTEFGHKQRLSVDDQGRIKDISIELWREYVRQTHAFRSGQRVRRYFEPIDRGVMEAASRVCEGHWLEFEDLQDYKTYPPDFSVLRETVNLRALAVYLRLIDLLDLAEDRTPYVIWKFVAPRDPRSKMAWNKHRALQPVTCHPYQRGRIIQVDGSTDDHEVYAALEDLRIWCEQQLRGCNDVLARMNDPRHKLDIYLIDWRVAARGFKPISIQFEFDRSRMFEILSEEIYQGDPYVFLRELLQNSIDAIRMRREILERRGISPGNLGVIRVNVEHSEGGDAIVTWHDDGIGMDEYIIRNYLAVAGKSYYRSADFEREGLKMDPISTFGVGILSCFMVADLIEIETYKDPYLPPPGEPLKIKIPAMRGQFRIETGTRETAEVGTTVKVFVEGKKLPILEEIEQPVPLDVIGYLSVVAGFVEFPIVITEGDRKAVVLHPKQDAEAARQRFGQEFQVHQIDLGYPWSQAIAPQDLAIAQEFLQERSLDLVNDLRLKGYEGALTYLFPKSDRTIIGSHSILPGVLLYAGKESWFEIRARLIRPIYGYDAAGPRLSDWLDSCYGYAVYRDGILIPEASEPASFRFEKDRPFYFPQPQFVVNLPKPQVPKVDLARTRLLGESGDWDIPIRGALLRHLSETTLKDILALDPMERCFQLWRFVGMYNIPAADLWRIFPHDQWPLLFLEPGGRLTVLEWNKVLNETLYISPRDISIALEKMIYNRWLTEDAYTGPLVEWSSETCVVGDLSTSRWLPYMSNTYWQLPLKASHELAALRFLTPPWEGDPPLLQEIWLPTKKANVSLDIDELARKLERSPFVSPMEYSLLLERYHDYGLPHLVEFASPFEKSFAYSFDWWNVRHLVTQVFCRVLVKIMLAELQKTLTEAQLGYLGDILPHISFTGSEHWGDWATKLRMFWHLAREFQLLDVDDIEQLVPRPEKFVPGSIGEEALKLRESREPLRPIHPFGQPLGR